MTVYIDVLFMRELIFDAVLLSITASLLKLKWIWWKIGLASILGAMYTIAFFFPEFSFIFHFVFKIAISIVMIVIAYGFRSLLAFLRIFITFYLVSFLAGGVTTGLYYLFLPSANAFWKDVLLMNNEAATVIQTSLLYLIAGFILAIVLITKSVSARKRQKLISDHIVNVTITLAQKELCCEALIDTGNQLYDPISRLPVVIVETALLQTAFPELISGLTSNKDNSYDFTQLPDEVLHQWQAKLKIIPFRSVNKDGQFIVALKVDELKFMHEGKIFITNKVLLGLEFGQLNTERQYKAILHPALLEA